MKLPHSPRGGRLMIGMLALLGMVPQAFAETALLCGPHSADCLAAQSGPSFRNSFPTGDGRKPLKEKYRTCLRSSGSFE